MSLTRKRMFFEDFTFLIDPSVYDPAEDSFLFAQNLKERKARKVIDVGTGCGILGIVMARQAEEVFAVDVNPYAVRCARQNAKLNSVAEKVVFIRGDLFSCIDSKVKFDLIMFNAPYLPSERLDTSWLEYSWAGGKSGRDVIDRFIDDAPEFLTPRGRILMMQSSLANVDKTLSAFFSKGFDSKVIASLNLPFFETIVLIAATRS
jgi:release factor glutamine methyltransferase